MGAANSTSITAASSSDDEEEELDDEEDPQISGGHRRNPNNHQKTLEQEPEILPCRAAASPLSAATTPRLLSNPSIKVWDPCNVLLPPAPNVLSLLPARAPDRCTEVFLLAHGECAVSLRPDLVGGRWPAAGGLTGNGERQARALAVFLKSQGVRFGEVYCSPLDRARATAGFVCRELGFAEEQIQQSDALVEMSQGLWEGCLRSEVYTPEMVSLIDRTQPDFCAPSGESLRQVMFRMIEFLNRTVLRLTDKMAVGDLSIHQNEGKELSRNSSTNSVPDRDGPQWDLHYRLNRPALQRKKSGKSRLQYMTTVDAETEDDYSPRDIPHGIVHDGSSSNPAFSIAIFTHAIPIKCLLTGILDCSPLVSNRLSVDDSSVSVLHHSTRTGWQIKRLNDTAHLRLL